MKWIFRLNKILSDGTNVFTNLLGECEFLGYACTSFAKDKVRWELQLTEGQVHQVGNWWVEGKELSSTLVPPWSLPLCISSCQFYWISFPRKKIIPAKELSSTERPVINWKHEGRVEHQRTVCNPLVQSWIRISIEEGTNQFGFSCRDRRCRVHDMTVVAQAQLLGQSVIISFRVSSGTVLKKEQIILDHPGFQEQRQRVPSSGQYCYRTKVCSQSITTTMHTLSWSYATGQFARHHAGKVVAGNSGGDLPYLADSDSQRLLHTGSAKLDTFARFPRGLQPSCNSPPSFPQSSGAVEHSGRQNVAGSGRKSGDNDSKGLKNLRNHSQKLRGTSQTPPQASPSLMRSDFPAVDGANMPISLSPSHPSGSVFIPTARIDVPFPECLRLGEGRVSISSMFRMALIFCVVAQWIKIAGALSMWTSRLRLKFFDSPLIYKDSTKSSKVGRVGVFWDLENCPVPSACDVPTVIEKVRAIGNTFGDILCFRAYGKLEYLTRQALPFLSKDVELCPVPDGKESADKAIILDASLFAFDHKPCLEDSEESKIENDVVLVVTGDRGFAALLQELSKRNITTIVIGNAHQTLPSVLSQSADISLGWEDMMICDEFDNDLFGKYNKSQPNRDPSMRSVCCNVEDPDLDSGSETRKVEVRDSSGVDCYQLDSNGSELFCTMSSEKPPPLVYGLKKVVSYISTREVKQTDCNTYESADSSKSYIPIGGKIRVLRHLRQEIAAVADKYLNKGTRINLREFVKLYEVEMGHALIPGYYGCGSMKNLLESMPDLVSLRPFASDSSELEVFPFFAKGRSSYGKINYSREDLRCILYELLHTKWPYGVKKDSLSSEHLRITGRPFVLVTYEFLKTGDVFGSMRDIVYIDPRTKQLHLVNGAQEPAGYSALARNHWN